AWTAWAATTPAARSAAAGGSHQAVPGGPHAAYSPLPPGHGGLKIRRVAGHKATQLVAVGLLGLVLGGGIVALADRDDHRRHGGGFDRQGHSRFDERGGGRFDERGKGGDRGERHPGGWPGRGPERDFER
ncbi:hypothetical protein, partial [Saccharothrix hoggarensis]